MKLVVGITGSTGVIYGIRLLEVLKEKGIETNLVMSEWAKKCVPMETKHDIEYVDVDNIPVRKWFHIAISLNHKYLDIYFNGQLRKRKELDSLPRQNYGEFWAGLFGGFEGYISKLQYHRKALDYKEVEAIVRESIVFISVPPLVGPPPHM